MLLRVRMPRSPDREPLPAPHRLRKRRGFCTKLSTDLAKQACILLDSLPVLSDSVTWETPSGPPRKYYRSHRPEGGQMASRPSVLGALGRVPWIRGISLAILLSLGISLGITPPKADAEA